VRTNIALTSILVVVVMALAVSYPGPAGWVSLSDDRLASIRVGDPPYPIGPCCWRGLFTACGERVTSQTCDLSPSCNPGSPIESTCASASCAVQSVASGTCSTPAQSASKDTIKCTLTGFTGDYCDLPNSNKRECACTTSAMTITFTTCNNGNTVCNSTSDENYCGYVQTP
jgi:hypothetical protein